MDLTSDPYNIDTDSTDLGSSLLDSLLVDEGVSDTLVAMGDDDVGVDLSSSDFGQEYSSWLNQSGIKPGADLPSVIDSAFAYSKDFTGSLSSKPDSELTETQLLIKAMSTKDKNIFGGTGMSNGEILTAGGLILTYIHQLKQDREDEAQQDIENQMAQEQLAMNQEALDLQAAELDMKYNPGAGVTRSSPNVFGKKG